jgi:hypothetical protein
VKAYELINLLEGWRKRHPRDAGESNVVVETENGGCPTRYMSHVVSAAQGFDWTANLFVIRTADRLVVERNIVAPLEYIAKQKLDALDGITIGSPHVSKNQRRAWIDGFVYGVRAHYTGKETR